MIVTNSLSLSHRISFLSTLFAASYLIWMHVIMTKIINERQPILSKEKDKRNNTF
ncbi:hypothetical protein C8P67_101135 [Flavobacterium aquicola]|uniref:Uncharacterized protein n=1 Tax=Flavobacterium aquicola TaxID=1682742 RepID=A0A3E0EU20_9FLAO|nr:hypothetical protein C8P67_101135 [Flavobacterium aquicola]